MFQSAPQLLIDLVSSLRLLMLLLTKALFGQVFLYSLKFTQEKVKYMIPR